MKEMYSYLASDVEIEGKVTCNGPVRVDGSCQGTIESKDSVTIGISGQISGTVRAESMVINGQVDGDLITSRSVAILSDGNIYGKIFTPAGCVTITKGGNFRGHFCIDQLPELPPVENPRIPDDVIRKKMLPHPSTKKPLDLAQSPPLEALSTKEDAQPS